MKYAKSVEGYIESKPEWKEALIILREMLSATSMEETVKWGMPTYTIHNKNVAGFSAFKAYVGIWFFQGVFLKDPGKKLINAQEGVTKGLRQWRFSSAEEIQKDRAMILRYLEEAIENQKAGKEIKADRKKPLEIPVELQKAMDSDPALKDRFFELSKSRQREYAEHVGMAKKEETRLGRLEKIKPMIHEGRGLHDKYKKP
jgi:uncharacterized protein YdeI (YjbR/CyaY-like superfamily)